jgi:deoxyribodipyrimidine photo-lyase
MIFETTRDGALKKLDNFIENEIINYNSKRNFDFGPKERKNVSCLSPYITHRLITEYETVERVLKKRPYQKVEKYVQEIFWRVYWKGWLELRPKVWTDFTEDLKNIKDDEKIQQAVNGKTQISCFNDWVNEIKEFNYLHNHTRMWFASIWIFTLKLPWQKGAEFFLKYLLDGDAASNTLSWRWVAGLQTKGKNYSAQSWNIEKFTNNKYKNIRLVENPIPLQDKREYKLTEIENFNNSEKVKNLIFFENDLNLENYNLNNYQNIYCLLLENDKRKIKLDQKVLDFKRIIIKNHLKTLSKDIKFLENSQNLNILDGVKELDVIYPSIGENLSFIKRLNKTKDIKFRFLKNEKDLFCWNFSNKGYFNFKSNIPKIITKFKLS